MICRCPGADPDELPRTNDFGLNVEEFSELAADCLTEYLYLAVRCCQVEAMLRPQFADILKILDIILDQLEKRVDPVWTSLRRRSERLILVRCPAMMII